MKEFYVKKLEKVIGQIERYDVMISKNEFIDFNKHV